GRVAFIGRIADDEYGRKIKVAFLEAGVDVSWGLEVVAGARSQFAFCVAEAGTGRRAIFWRPPSVGQLDPDQIDLARATDTAVALVDGHHIHASVALARACNERGIPVVSDLERPREVLPELLRLCDWPILPIDFALALAGTDDLDEAGQRLCDMARGQVIVTMGTNGSVAFTPAGRHYQPAFEITPVVDTTGAGDVYHGAFAYALARGANLFEAMRFASAAAALSCRALGGRAGLPTIDEVRALLARGERMCPE
ncbi:MAG: sugar kinase, partial [Armatimonadetes bacterium]|nr:sugar kinase [Armatimonadota bacterium]